ncbi:MAG: polysaccharide deacetylase family protein [Bacteroidales bacterium]
MIRTLLFLALFPLSLALQAQKKVAITIDDVPNTGIFQASGSLSPLLEMLDSLNIPVAVFINEGLIYKTDALPGNFSLLNDWVSKPRVTAGNHTFGHLRASEVSMEAFSRDVLKGEAITRELTSLHGKALDFFRFPYNDLGADSLQHNAVKGFLENEGYRIAPFTIESSDWMFNNLYQHYLEQQNPGDAARIKHAFIDYTLEMFTHFEQLSQERFQRPINHIFLCHDNALMAASLPVLLENLQTRGYSLISLEEAMADEAYLSEEHYYGRWGFSWIYRWMEDPAKRKSLMQQEPSMMDVYHEHEALNKK